MDKKQFIDMASAPGRFTSQDRGWLKAQLAKYPYSSVVATLALLADRAYGFDTPEERRAVALSVCDPDVLDSLLSRAASGPAVDSAVASAPASTPARSVAPTAASTTASTATATRAAAPAPVDSSFDVLNEINTFQEVSFKTAPKSVILSNFLKVDPSEEENEASGDTSGRDINDKKSLMPDVSLGTETLAVILEQQGRYDKALAIYKNLLANNPEKSSIFAPRIQRLTTILSSK